MTRPAPIARRRQLAPESSSAVLALAKLTAPGPTAKRPRVALAGELVRVGNTMLTQVDAVRLWADLGSALGMAERERRPLAWSYLVEWLDTVFQDGADLEVRELRERLVARVIRIGPRRALARVGPFAVAHLRLLRPRSRTWTGRVAHYFPGPMGTGPSNPDPLVSFTTRTIRAHIAQLEAAPEVTP